MSWDWFGYLRFRPSRITARFEAVPIGNAVKLGIEAVVERPTVFRRHCFGGPDEVKAVVAVEPRPAASKHIANAALRDVKAKAVDIAAFSVFRGVVVIAVSVAVEHEVVGAAPQPEADGLPVAHGKLLVDVVIALVVEADRLGVRFDRYLHAD